MSSNDNKNYSSRKAAQASQEPIREQDAQQDANSLETKETLPLPQGTPNGIDRVYSHKRQIKSDLYKLLVANYIKREGQAFDPDVDPKSFIEAEHVHFYHTFDSNGKKLTRCAAIGGHYHLIELGEAEEGQAAPIISVSGPMKIGKKKVKGQTKIVDVPLNNYDHHTHKWVYLQTDTLSVRATSTEAVKVQAMEANKGARPSGVIMGG